MLRFLKFLDLNNSSDDKLSEIHTLVLEYFVDIHTQLVYSKMETELYEEKIKEAEIKKKEEERELISQETSAQVGDTDEFTLMMYDNVWSSDNLTESSSTSNVLLNEGYYENKTKSTGGKN